MYARCPNKFYFIFNTATNPYNKTQASQAVGQGLNNEVYLTNVKISG